MMRATVTRKPCSYCGEVSWFQRECTGPRGAHIRWEPCCVDCGERPAKRSALMSRHTTSGTATAA